MKRRATFTRRGRYGIAVNVILASLLAPALGLFLLYLAFRPEYRLRLDFTAKQAYTLSDRTLKILESLADPVDVYTCFRPENFNSAGRFAPGLDQVIYLIGQHTNDLVREYELDSRGRIRGHLYDPSITGHIGRIEELSQRLGEPAKNLVVVEAGERRKVLRLPDLADFDDGAQSADSLRRSRLVGFRDEEALSSAVLAVTEERQTRIAFLTGHGERDPNAQGMDAGGRGGYSRFVRSLFGQNFEVALLDLARESLAEVGPDILVLAAPTVELPEDELGAIVDFVAGGGKLLLLLDPLSPIALDYPLLDQTLGLRRLPGELCVIREIGEWQRNPVTFNEVAYGFNSEVVKMHRDRGLGTLWHEVVSFEPLGRAEHGDLVVTPLVWTSEEAWLDLPPPGAAGAGNRAFDPGAETRRRRSFAFSVERPGGGRAVVVGDSDFLSDLYITEAAGNRTLGLNAVEWLAEREQLISVEARLYDEPRVDLTEDEYGTIFLYTVVAIPGFCLLLALAVFWTRRQ